MAQRNASGTNAIPRLVIKIIGGKQVKQFVEEPEGDTKDSSPMSKKADSPHDVDNMLKEPSAKQDIMVSKFPRLLEDQVDSVLQAVLHQAPNRMCVTAPSGDRSLSYIHQKSFHRTEPKEAKATEDMNGLPEEEKDKKDLSLAVSEELSDWQSSSLRSTEEEMVALDPTFRGTLNKSGITDVFLKNEVPLKLPTFYLLLQMFSDKNDPDQIHYRSLLHFIRGVDELHNSSKAAARCMLETSVVHRAAAPAGDLTPNCAAPVETETWLQRFQRLERAMHLSDTQKTGYMDKDKAKRLIQNYNHILDLKLSTLKISEATHSARNQSQIHLVTALQCLKEL